MRLGLTITYRLLWAIEALSAFGAGVALYHKFDWEGFVAIVLFVGTIHIVFTDPIGKKLKEDVSDQDENDA